MSNHTINLFVCEVFVQFTLSSKIVHIFYPAQQFVEDSGNTFQKKLMPENHS